MEEKEIVFPRPNRGISIKILLCYFASLYNPKQFRDPIYSLIFKLSEILNLFGSDIIGKTDFSKFLFFNKDNINNLLYDNEDLIIFEKKYLKYSLSYLFYLSLLIRDNPDIYFYSYPLDYLIEINNRQRSHHFIYTKIIVVKILMDLAENYKKNDDFMFENADREKIANIIGNNETLLRNNLGELKEIDLNWDIEYIKNEKTDVLLIEIIIGLLTTNQLEN